jgi:hypothetical protein
VDVVKAVAGSDIKPGMWIVIDPGLQAVQVDRIDVMEASGWLRVWDKTEAVHILNPRYWYAEVEF